MFFALAIDQASLLDKINIVIDLAPAAKVGQKNTSLKNICERIWLM